MTVEKLTGRSYVNAVGDYYLWGNYLPEHINTRIFQLSKLHDDTLFEAYVYSALMAEILRLDIRVSTETGRVCLDTLVYRLISTRKAVDPGSSLPDKFASEDELIAALLGYKKYLGSYAGNTMFVLEPVPSELSQVGNIIPINIKKE